MKKLKIYVVFLLLMSVLSCSKEPSTPEEIFESISAQEIIDLEPSMTNDMINSTHGPDNEIPEGSILVFRTGNGGYGKMLMHNNTIEENYLEFRYELFDHKGELIKDAYFTSVRRTFTFDFETNMPAAPSKDFWWEWNQFNNGGMDGTDKFLVPRQNSIFYIYLN